MVATIAPSTIQTASPSPKAKTGLVGFLCDVTGEPVEFIDCLACAASGAPGCSFHPALISEIINKVRDPEYANQIAAQNGAEAGFSATEIVGCPRQLVLKKRYPHYESIGAMYRMFFGTGGGERVSHGPIPNRLTSRLHSMSDPSSVDRRTVPRVETVARRGSESVFRSSDTR